MKTETTAKGRRARILIAGSRNGLGRISAGVIEEHLGQPYDLRVSFADSADNLLKLARARGFDLFIVIACSLAFSFETSRPRAQSDEEMVLQLIRYLRRRYKTPVLALHGWNERDFGERIDAADHSLKYPRVFGELRAAVQGFLAGNFEGNAYQRRKLAPESRRGTVLIADEDTAACQVCWAFLESIGFKAYVTQSTGHAISILNRIKIDVVITGILFLGLDRHLLSHLIKQRFKADTIFMGDSTTACVKPTAAGTASVDLLCKPFELKDLQDSVERIIRRRNLEKFRKKFGYAGRERADAGEKRFSKTEYFLSGGRHTAAIIPEEEGFELMQKLGSLLTEFGTLPDEPDGVGTLLAVRDKRHDPNRLFEVFDRLRPMDGCTLDYCLYRFDEFKLPYIYTRRIDSKPITDHKEFIERFPYRRCRIRHIEVEPSPSGFFQFAVFYNTVNQFHLSGHCRPGLTHPVTTQNQLKRALDCIAGKAGRREIMRKYSLRSRLGVLMCEDLAKIIFIAFNPFRGLYFQHTYIRSNSIEYVDRIQIPDCDIHFEF